MIAYLDWILKQPGKAVFYLLTIMILLVVRNTYGAGFHPTRAGPIRIVKCFHEFSGGVLNVNGNRVETSDGGGDLYQISVGQNFTLYDPRAGKFICWNKTKGSGKRRFFLEARHYTKYLKIDNCLFSDIPIPDPGYRATHVSLVHRKKNQLLRMKFKKNGAFTNRHCNFTEDPMRHRHRCIKQAAFLVSGVKPFIPCPRAEEFCRTELRKMPELRECCKHFIWSNETTD